MGSSSSVWQSVGMTERYAADLSAARNRGRVSGYRMALSIMCGGSVKEMTSFLGCILTSALVLSCR